MWPCANDPAAAWLHTAIARIVTTYTQPGHRVLLLTPPGLRPHRRASIGRPGPDSDPYVALPQTAQTAARLGRSASTQTADKSGPAPVDLAIVAVAPHATAWTRAIPWPAMLTAAGLLAVITHTGRRDGRLVDPVPEFVTTARRAGLRYHDHVALLCVPIRSGRLLEAPARQHTAHHDLLIFNHGTSWSEAPHA